MASSQQYLQAADLCEQALERLGTILISADPSRFLEIYTGGTAEVAIGTKLLQSQSKVQSLIKSLQDWASMAQERAALIESWRPDHEAYEAQLVVYQAQMANYNFQVGEAIADPELGWPIEPMKPIYPEWIASWAEF